MTKNDEWSDKSEAVIAPPPVAASPPTGTANVRILPGFPTHVFVIPSHDLTLTQNEWTNIPQSQISEITQIASENQILLEVDEGSAS